MFPHTIASGQVFGLVLIGFGLGTLVIYSLVEGAVWLREILATRRALRALVVTPAA
jgi:hypothetical protein